jgi:hypothetical protein
MVSPWLVRLKLSRWYRKTGDAAASGFVPPAADRLFDYC